MLKIKVGEEFSAKATGYHPENSAMEGGFHDALGQPLCTLRDYLAGKASYVSVAMDAKGDMKQLRGSQIQICFSEEQKASIAKAFGISDRSVLDRVVYKVVDTGGAFTGKGTNRLDICSGNSSRTDSLVTGKIAWRVVKPGESLSSFSVGGSLEHHEADSRMITSEDYASFWGAIKMDEERRKLAEEKRAKEQEDSNSDDPK